MGLWGAAQAIAFGLGGLLGAAMVDLMNLILGDHLTAYASVFSGEAVLFLIAGMLALRIGNVAKTPTRDRPPAATAIGENLLLETAES